MIGSFGDIIFETSDQRILTFTGMKLDAIGRWADHDRIGAKPMPEFIGPGLQSVSFTVDLNGNLGVKPREEMGLWLEYAESGFAEYLIINTTPLGSDMWIVKSVSQAWGMVLNAGELFSGKIDVTLGEYITEV